MDPIISKLNQAAQIRIKQATPASQSLPVKADFSSKFDQTLADRLLEKMKEDYGTGSGNDMTVLSAEDVHVETAGEELGGEKLTANDQFFDLFREVNKDLVSLDGAIETLTTPGLKITPRQLLALQAGVANTTILAEGFSRFTDAVARGIQTIVQTQVG